MFICIFFFFAESEALRSLSRRGGRDRIEMFPSFSVLIQVCPVLQVYLIFLSYQTIVFYLLYTSILLPHTSPSFCCKPVFFSLSYKSVIIYLTSPSFCLSFASYSSLFFSPQPVCPLSRLFFIPPTSLFLFTSVFLFPNHSFYFHVCFLFPQLVCFLLNKFILLISV